MPAFDVRSTEEEMMDDFSIVDDRLTGALAQLRLVNRLLGGYHATMSVLAPYLLARRGTPLHVLDLGTGIADYPEYLIRWADRRGVDLHITAVDANPVTVAQAEAALDRRLPAPLRQRIHLVVADALDLPYAAGAFSVTHASLFLHHFGGEAAVTLLRAMDRLATDGLIVNDLHRHRLAYYSIRGLSAVLPVSDMFRNDAPLSVLRGFRRAELTALAAAAGLPPYRLRWHWAFRWSLTTVETDGEDVHA